MCRKRVGEGECGRTLSIESFYYFVCVCVCVCVCVWIHVLIFLAAALFLQHSISA